jgi:predicted nucleic acid-binding protein
MTLVIDTDVASFIYKGDTRAALYTPHLVCQIPIISFMTLAEMRHWTNVRNWGVKRRQHLEQHLNRYAVFFADDNLCSVWAEVMSDAKKNGYPIDVPDAWIVSTALLLSVPLITHNKSHFINVIGLTVISEKSP